MDNVRETSYDFPAVEITWSGHACFVLKGKEKTVVTDPYYPDLFGQFGHVDADIVTVSHPHPGHSYVQGVGDSPCQVTGPGEYEIGGVFITGIPTYHDDQSGTLRGRNTLYVIEMDGLALCHAGDIGHSLPSPLIEEIGSVDVLFLPVGEVSTLGIDAAIDVVRQLEARIVVPMHYKTSSTVRQLQPVDRFLSRMGTQDVRPRPVLTITPSSLPASTQVVVLDDTHGAG